MFVSFIRTGILYLVIIFALRLMGKRQIGELQPSELVVTILISEVASIPMQDPTAPLLGGVVPVLTLLSLEMILAFLSIKFPGVRMVLAGRPSIIIHNGALDLKELERLRLSISDLTEELRLKDVLDIKTVWLAIVETNGKISVFLKSEENTVKLRNLGLKGENENLATPVVVNGHMVPGNLKKAGIEKKWMLSEMKTRGAKKIGEVFYFAVDENKNIVFLRKGEGEFK